MSENKKTLILEGIKDDYTLDFYFDIDKVYIHNIDRHKTYRVKDDSSFTYCFQKTQIKAADGIQGLYKFIKKDCIDDTLFRWTLESVLRKALQGGN